MKHEMQESWESRLYCSTDVLQMLTILVAMAESEGKQVYITTEMIQDFGRDRLFIESSFDTANVRLTTKRKREMEVVR